MEACIKRKMGEGQNQVVGRNMSNVMGESKCHIPKKKLKQRTYKVEDVLH